MYRSKIIASLVNFFIGILLTGCAQTTDKINDPYEETNRKIFDFNAEFIKKYHDVTDPETEEVYDETDELSIIADHFFSNLYEINNMAHDVLQFKLAFLLNDFWRFTINSTLGCFGILDVARHFGLPHHYQDFSKTLAYWDIKNPPYLVLPFLGPNDTFSALSIPVDYGFLLPWPAIHGIKYNLFSQYIYSLHLMSSSKPIQIMMLEAIDPYIFARDGYLQRREFLNEPEDYVELKEDLLETLKFEAEEE
jgi:phospholipid-binding lipoprotein MlaA